VSLQCSSIARSVFCAYYGRLRRLHSFPYTTLFRSHDQERFPLDIDDPPVRLDPTVRRAADVDQEQQREIVLAGAAQLVEAVGAAPARGEIGVMLDARVEIDVVAVELPAQARAPRAQ